MRVEQDDRIEIRRTGQVERLDTTMQGDTRRHYLLCARDCGTLLEVPWAVLAAMCASCLALEDRETT